MLLPGLLIAASFAAPPTPRDDVLRHVPTDAAVVLVVQNLRDQAATVAASPFAQWAGAKFGPKVAGSNEFNVLKGFEKILTDALGVTVAELRDDVLGDTVVFAFTPGLGGDPDADRGVILLHARDPKKLQSVIDKLNAVQKDRGELKAVEAVKYGDNTYAKRAKPGGGGEYYFLRGNLFAFSGQEAMLKAVLDRADLSAAVSPATAGLKAIGLQDAFLAAWVNPRALDKDLAARAAAEANPAQKAFLEQLGRVWAATDGVGIGLTVGTDIELKVAATVNVEKMPSELRPILPGPPAPGAFLSEGEILEATFNIRPNEILAAISSFAPVEEREKIKKDLEKAIGPVVGRNNVGLVLGSIGPALSVTVGRPGKSGDWFPNITARAQLADDEKARAAVARLIDFWSQLVAVEYNKSHDDQIDVSVQNGITVFDNPKGFPAGLQPQFGVKSGMLTVRTGNADKLGPVPDGPTPHVILSAAGLRDYLKAHGDPAAAWLAKIQDRDAAELKKELVTIADTLEPVDRLELTAVGTANTVSLSLKIKTVKPLK